MNNNTLETSLKNLIINSLGLEDINIEDIDADLPLFSQDGLGLDSVDALELGLAIQKEYHLKIDNNAQEVKQHFKSVNTLSKYIKTQIGE